MLRRPFSSRLIFDWETISLPATSSAVIPRDSRSRRSSAPSRRLRTVGLMLAVTSTSGRASGECWTGNPRNSVEIGTNPPDLEQHVTLGQVGAGESRERSRTDHRKSASVRRRPHLSGKSESTAGNSPARCSTKIRPPRSTSAGVPGCAREAGRTHGGGTRRAHAVRAAEPVARNGPGNGEGAAARRLPCRATAPRYLLVAHSRLAARATRRTPAPGRPLTGHPPGWPPAARTPPDPWPLDAVRVGRPGPEQQPRSAERCYGPAGTEGRSARP